MRQSLEGSQSDGTGKKDENWIKTFIEEQVGMLFNANTMVKYKVPGGSLAFNSTYYDFDRRFLVGVEVAKNIMQHKASSHGVDFIFDFHYG